MLLYAATIFVSAFLLFLVQPVMAKQILPWFGGSATVWTTCLVFFQTALLAVSNHITQNIAAVPLLWILPLALYLLTFILCFDGSGWYRREIFLSMLAAALGVMAWTLADPKLTHELEIQVGVFSGGLFIACMFCHGELTRLKPAPRYLTRFYLMISVGGAAGSVLVGIVAPLVLPAYFELAAGLILCSLLLLWQVRREAPVYGVLGLVGTAVAVGCAIWGVTAFYANAIVASRNFYGVLRVQELGDNDANRRRSLVHGTILHGTQYLGPEVRQRATTYYTATSGIGRLLESMHPRMDPIRVGVIGLGTGTLAIYGSKGDVYRFYEINPDVIEVAQRDFTFLSDSDATIELALGDARLSLEREPAQSLDVLAIDAFSSDAIPVHLITSEAVGIYRRHLKPGGVIAFHVTNRFLNLIPVVEALAQAHGLQVMHLPDGGLDAMATRSDWVLLTTDVRLLARPELAGHAQEIVARRDWRLWTDAFNNLVQVLK